jgi:hypothetical protein
MNEVVEVMDTVERLVAIEAIKNIKARYWYAMDLKDWDALEKVFSEDAIWDARYELAFAQGHTVDVLPPVQEAIAAGHPAVAVGARGCMEFMRANVETWKTFHLGGAPIIEVNDPDSGTGIWPIFDTLDYGQTWQGYGHYHEEYRRRGGRWLISLVRLTRIRGEGVYPGALATIAAAG